MSQSRSKGLKWVIALCWVIGALVVIAGCIIGAFAIYLSPDRIARLIEEKGSQYLRAEIKIGKLDYKLFSTYPWLKFELDSLDVISKSLEDITALQLESLPSNSDSLASVVKIKGMVNVHSLLHHKLNLKEIEISQPVVNLIVVNDSINNFNIAPHFSEKMKTPEISLSEINVTSPVKLNYFSLKDDVDTRVNVDDFFLTKNSDNSYEIGFEGMVGGHFQVYKLPGNIPVKFSTHITPRFPETSLDLQKLYIAYSGLQLSLEGDVRAGLKGIDLNDATLKLSVDNLFEFIHSLPENLQAYLSLPEEVEGVLPINLLMTLQEPYHFNPQSFSEINLKDIPNLLASIYIEDANLLLSPPNQKRVEADDVYFNADITFDPQNSDATNLIIHELRMNGEGISLSGMAEITNLTGENQTFEGDVRFNSGLLQTLAYFLPKSVLKMGGHLKGDVKFKGTAKNFGKEGLTGVEVWGKMNSNIISVSEGKNVTLGLKKMKTDFKAVIPRYPFNDNYAGLKLEFDFSSDSLLAEGAGADIKIGKLEFNLNAMDTLSGTPDPYGNLMLKLDRLQTEFSQSKFRGDNIILKANGSLNTNGPGNYNAVPATEGGAEALIESRVKHTPLVVVYDGGGILQTIMGMLNMKADFTMGKGKFETPYYLYPIEMDGLEASTNLNQVKLSVNDVKAGRSAGSVSGVFTGLLPFLTSYTSTPLDADFDIKFSNVDINQLSWGYYGSLMNEGKDSVFYMAPVTPYNASDSVCVVIPRNIYANVRLFSKAAEYMQYKFAPLSTNILVKNGVATLGALTIGSPYCTAIVDWTYSTANLDNIFMDLKAKVKDFQFSPFYDTFPALVAKASEIHNLSGGINADVDCHFRMFPDMFIDGESLSGRFDIKGNGLEFARQGRIERLTHLMMIKGDEPIQIQNLEITGAFHDNLLQVNPFKVKFEDYQLSFAGVNNTSGEMYYHIALEKSPFHLPFGVNLIGSFKNPEVRLGGTHIDDYRSEMISTNLSSKINVNIMAYLHNGWLMFVQEAAKYEGRHLKEIEK